MTKFITSLAGRKSRIVANVGLGVYTVGTIASLIAQNADMFQRFGSIGVAAAILFFTDRLLQVELRRQESVERILHEFGVELEVMKEGVPAKDIPNEGFEVDYLEEEAKFSTLRGHAEKINSRNIVLLTVATLQWGFGEIFVRGVFG